MDQIELDFRRFHANHPEIYVALRDLALQFKRQGRKRYSIKGLYEIARYRHTLVKGPTKRIEINNNYTSLYARLLMQNEPTLKDFFEVRSRRAPQQPA